MSRRRLLLLCGVLCAALACKPGASTAPSHDASPPGAPAQRNVCPVKVPTTTVTVINTKDGVAMYFTTIASYVDEVRRRTAALAATAVQPPVATPAADNRRSFELAPWEVAALAGMVPSRATAEDIEEGSRLLLVPSNPADLEALRAYARAQGERMRLGDCPADFLKGRTKAASQPPSPEKQG